MFAFDTISIMGTVIFVLVIGAFLVVIVRGITQWHRNNNSPRLASHATVTSKRINVSGGGGTADAASMTSTAYYVTFETTGRERIEFRVSGREYGQLAEGDQGILQYQGTRFLEFERG